MRTQHEENITVAEYFARTLNRSGVDPEKIAKLLGHDNPAIIRFVISGHAKLPVSSILPLAAAFGIDPLDFLAVVLREYCPDVLEAITRAIYQLDAVDPTGGLAHLMDRWPPYPGVSATLT